MLWRSGARAEALAAVCRVGWWRAPRRSAAATTRSVAIGFGPPALGFTCWEGLQGCLHRPQKAARLSSDFAAGTLLGCGGLAVPGSPCASALWVAPLFVPSLQASPPTLRASRRGTGDGAAELGRWRLSATMAGEVHGGREAAARPAVAATRSAAMGFRPLFLGLVSWGGLLRCVWCAGGLPAPAPAAAALLPGR